MTEKNVTSALFAFKCSEWVEIIRCILDTVNSLRVKLVSLMQMLHERGRRQDCLEQRGLLHGGTYCTNKKGPRQNTYCYIWVFF